MVDNRYEIKFNDPKYLRTFNKRLKKGFLFSR